MNADDIIWRLAQLASLRFQERYVIGGTSEEFVLDAELLENVDSLKFSLRRPENQDFLTQEQVAALEDLFSAIEESADKALSGGSREEGALLIRESQIWKSLRSKAGHALNLFGVSVEEMSAEEVDAIASK